MTAAAIKKGTARVNASAAATTTVANTRTRPKTVRREKIRPTISEGYRLCADPRPPSSGMPRPLLLSAEIFKRKCHARAWAGDHEEAAA